MSRWKNLTGSLRTTTVRDDGTAKALAAELLDEVMVPLTSQIRLQHDKVGDLAFAYKEVQFHSVLLPALREVAVGVFREQPIIRGKRDTGDDAKGNVDYWMSYEDQVVLMELKHAFSAVRSESETKKLREESWGGLLEQVDTLVEHAGPRLTGGEGKAVAIGLMVVVHWATGDLGDADDGKRAAAWKRHKRMVAELDEASTQPIDWHALWQVPRDMQLSEWGEGEDARSETYPAVSFLAVARRARRTARA